MDARTPWPFGPLQPYSYDLTMFDPPWPTEMRSAKGEEKSSVGKYGKMEFSEIGAMPVGMLGKPDSVLFTWCTWPLILHGGDPKERYRDFNAGRSKVGEVLHRLGARYVTGGAWFKRTVTGKAAFGTGYRVRTTCEPFLLSIFGNPDSRGARRSRNVIESIEENAFDGLRRGHSQKPEEAYAWCECYMPAGSRFCEIFSRTSRPRWDTWGLQAGMFDPVVYLDGRPADLGLTVRAAFGGAA